MERKASATRSDLDQMLVDETMQPKPLLFWLLEDITDDFSDDLEIGSGGFAVVYKGILGDRAVAVKRMSNALMDETKFHREIKCLMRVKHKNVVRFLGYCDDRQGNMEMYNGKLVMADVHQRLLCFEYTPKGSLDNYITDAYREWGTCYNIIKEVCEGLQFLHENNIIHLDLKPANILLDNNMVPKITDFGLSRCFDQSQSRDITQTRLGTLGYLAPEYLEEGVIARSTDLYSLGVIIIEILTGQKGDQAIEDVLERWSDRLERSHRDIQVEQIRVCYEIALECRKFNPKKRPASAQNILDKLYEMESTQTVSKTAIGFMEVGILGARDLAGMKNPYAVAKYDEKWVRTRTLLNTAAPQWNEQYTWEVFDLSTVITIAVFDNNHLSSSHSDAKDGIDQQIGKVRIRLATLETDRVYRFYYPLTPSGLKKMGELHLAVRFTCMSWPKMLAMYGKPLLPKINHTDPISRGQHVDLRPRVVAHRLEQLEPPLQREVVEYMLDLDSNKVNFYRITSLFSNAVAIAKCLDDICKWKNPLTTILVLVVFLVSVCYPMLILPMVSLCMIMIGVSNYRRRPSKPPHMGELAEEFDTFLTSKPGDEVLMGYDRPRSVAGRWQAVVCDLAMHAERVQSLVSWRDPKATLICITLFLVMAVALYLTPFRVVAMVMGLYCLRPPWFRGRSNLTLQ